MKLVLNNGKEIELSEELTKQLEDVVINEEMKFNAIKTGFHDFNNKDKYNAIEFDGSIENYENTKDYMDEDLHNYLNAYTTEEFAEKIAFKQLVERKLLKFSLEHDYDKIEKDNWNVKKYIIRRDNEGEIYTDFTWRVDLQGAIPFYSEEICQQAIEEFYDDLVKYFQLDFSEI